MAVNHQSTYYNLYISEIGQNVSGSLSVKLLMTTEWRNVSGWWTHMRHYSLLVDIYMTYMSQGQLILLTGLKADQWRS